MSTQPLNRSGDLLHAVAEPALHLLRVADPNTRTSTGILLSRTPTVTGAETGLRDVVLLLTTVHRNGVYESFAGTVVRTQFNGRTVVIHPRTHTLMGRTEGTFAVETLTHAHEAALNALAERYRDDAQFRDWATPATP